MFHFTPPVFQGVPFYPAFKIIFLKIQKCRYEAEFARASTLIDLTSIDMLKPHFPCLPKFARLTFRKSLLTTEQNSNKKLSFSPQFWADIIFLVHYPDSSYPILKNVYTNFRRISHPKRASPLFPKVFHFTPRSILPRSTLISFEADLI